MYPHSFKEELESGLYCDILLGGDHNRHLGKSINHQENIVISLLSGRKDVIHGYGFPGPVGSRHRGVHAWFLNGRFGNGTSRARPDIVADILSEFCPIEMLLQHHHCVFYVEVSCHPTIVSFPNAKMAQMAQQPIL
jgi:hypothetical protein